MIAIGGQKFEDEWDYTVSQLAPEFQPTPITEPEKQPSEEAAKGGEDMGYYTRRTKDAFSSLTGEGRQKLWPERFVDEAKNVVNRVVNTITGEGKLPTRVGYPGAALEDDPEANKNIGAVAELAGAMIFGPAPIARAAVDGTLGSIAGVGAKGADKYTLMVAKLGEKTGQDPEAIFKYSGWFKGGDGKWRFELPSHEMKYLDPLELDTVAHVQYRTGVQEPATVTLNRVVDYPSLFKAYPELKDMPVEFRRIKENALAQYDQTEKRIIIDVEKIKFYEASVESTLIHEIQHAIQHKEGFAYGTTWQHAYEDLYKLWEKAPKEKKDELSKLMNKYMVKESLDAEQELYIRAPGEREARLVEGRREWTAAEKRGESPLRTYRRIDEIKGTKEFKSDFIKTRDIMGEELGNAKK